MNRHILLINPWIHDFSAYDLWYKPLGLLSLASLLRRHGARISYIDCLAAADGDPPPGRRIRSAKTKPTGEGSYRAEWIPKPEALRAIPRNYHRYGISPDEFRRRAASLARPDLILVTSMMTYWYPGLFDAIAAVKAAHPGVPVVLGGNYVTLCPDHARLSGADICLPGRGETTLPPLLHDLLGFDLPRCSGEEPLDLAPYPAFDLVRPLRYVPLLTSRGCPYRCSYCASSLLAGRFRRRDPIRVVDEIAHWYNRFGIVDFSFYDDALLVEPQQMAIPMLEEIRRRGLAVRFHCPNGLHLREITSRIAKLLVRGGFRTLRFGFETSNRTRQRDTGGKVGDGDLARAVAYLREGGYEARQIGIYILCGLPGQPAEEVAESIRHVQHAGARPIIAEYSPIPGTGLWQEALRSSPYPLAEEPLFQNNTLLPCRSETLTGPVYQALKRAARSGSAPPGHRPAGGLDNRGG